MEDKDEEERLIAVLQGNYLAKYFPTIWRNKLNKPLQEELQQAFDESNKTKSHYIPKIDLHQNLITQLNKNKSKRMVKPTDVSIDLQKELARRLK